MRLLSLLLLLFLGACAQPAQPGVTELVYATPYGPNHPFSLADQRWMQFVEQRSGGRLRVRPIWSGGLLSSDMSMEELRHGVADIGLITPIYVRGGTHLIRMQSGFYSGAESIASQVSLYRCLEANLPQIGEEIRGLKVLAVQGGALPGIVTRDRPVRSLADLRGMRLRAPTELLTVLESLGVDAVNMPMADVYSSMAKGVIDGVVAPPDTFAALHFAEISDHFTQLSVPRGAYPARAMAAARWNRLAPADRAVLQESIAVWEAALDEEIGRATQRGFDAARAEGVTMIPVTAQDQARFDQLYLQDAARNARSLQRFGIDGPGAFRLARDSVVGPGTIDCAGAAPRRATNPEVS